ncbi:hypothetical protein [Geomonas propionica]|uniref:Uncharacterized protein n=1 Tax=Geomonas propionica TaxID=2798582 RepID=A0ABS0YP30_9BACT|nr:hypothetical protein [Geomonas propionica]MBJ6799660.1 hypothetical protein [Geomonas propionica]
MPFNNVSHPEMIGKAAPVVQALTPEFYAYLVSIFPTPQSINELYQKYQASFTASLPGDDPEKVKECEADREALNHAIGLLVGFGKVANRKDPTILEKLGLSHIVEKPAGTAKGVGKVSDFRVLFDSNGKPYVSLAKLGSAKGYDVWACAGDPSVESNWKSLVWSTSCKKIPIVGLDRSVPNFLRIRGKRGDAVGSWSHFIKLDPA